MTGLKCQGWCNTASDFTLVKAFCVWEGDKLAGRNINLLALPEFLVTVPLSKIHSEYGNFSGKIVVGIRESTTTDILIGNDITTRFN